MKSGPSGPLRPGWREDPARSRLAPGRGDRAEILVRHGRACASGLSSYVDPATGDSVLTACYLADRGFCCGQGCRHCPWEGADVRTGGDGDPAVSAPQDPRRG